MKMKCSLCGTEFETNSTKEEMIAEFELWNGPASYNPTEEMVVVCDDCFQVVGSEGLEGPVQ